jgi:hypothetical protein
MIIGAHPISAYIFYWWLLVVLLLMAIMVIILMSIGGYSINAY